jgi:Regulator of ribonuclease activity B
MNSDLETAAEVFKRMHGDGWDTSSPLKWGYFFFHSSRDPLLELRKALEDVDYHFEELHETDDSEWVLQMSKAEVHTPESLHKRNLKFNELVEQWGIDLYDGWDVGKISV